MTRVICVLGMHRSGTSAAARLLNLLGVDLGPAARVETSGVDNPKGYWEYRPFVDVNDEILARFGGSWHEPPVLPADWVRDARLDDLKAKARALIAEDFDAAPLWGWKDPRACLTMPFWQEVVGPMRYVICLRNPGEVVASLTERTHMPVAEPELLWLTHVRATLADTREAPRLFLFYEDLITDWRPEARRVAAFIGEPARAEDPAVLAAIDEHLERKMRHHQVSPAALVTDPRLSFATKSLYVALRTQRDAAEPVGADQHSAGQHGAGEHSAGQPERETEARATLAALADRAVETFTHTRAIAGERDDLILSRDTLATERDQLLDARTALTAEREALTAERNALIAQRELMIGEHEAERARHEAVARQFHARITALDATATDDRARQAALTHQIGQLEAKAAALGAAHDSLQRMIEEMHASFAWRAVTKTRQLIIRLLPAGTRRRRLFHAMLHRFGPHRSAGRARPLDADRPVA